MAYKIVFIDEQRSEQNQFKAAFDVHKKSGEVCIITLFPAPTLDEMIANICELHPDALVSDWNLNEIKTDLPSVYEVDYYGSELISEFRKIRTDFPCFIASSYDTDASHADSTYDVNQVYSKELNIESFDNEQHLTFPQKVILQIQKYNKRIDDAKNELHELCSRKFQNEMLTVFEEQKIIELDSFLEKTFGADSAVPDELKSTTNSKQLSDLLESVNKVLETIKNVK
ncbi:MAG: hypothetical protein I8H74_06510 [Moraxellaceae bacterium]|nr:hypothetical protein [Moraxellaceae bacterium]